MSENRIAIISIIVEDRAASAQINKILSDFGDFVVGRMGIPYSKRQVSVMCVVVDAPTEVINTVTGKIGMLAGVSAKTVTSKK
ncbi:MAG: iron-only hydrogenase system regulator [Roseburia sp.]|nr:iron-only hydrogenase system regulator [Roseburia sp.]